MTATTPATEDPPRPGAELPIHFSGCFACGDVPGGLRMRFVAGAGETVVGTFAVQPGHQGAPGIAHGGVLAAAFDEALGMLAHFTREPAVTGRLTTSFRRPVPVGTVLHFEARIDGRSGRRIMTSAVARLDAPDGPVAADAEAVFVTVPMDHFDRHGRAREVAAARRERGESWPFDRG